MKSPLSPGESIQIAASRAEYMVSLLKVLILAKEILVKLENTDAVDDSFRELKSKSEAYRGPIIEVIGEEIRCGEPSRLILIRGQLCRMKALLDLIDLNLRKDKKSAVKDAMAELVNLLTVMSEESARDDLSILVISALASMSPNSEGAGMRPLEFGSSFGLNPDWPESLQAFKQLNAVLPESPELFDAKQQAPSDADVDVEPNSNNSGGGGRLSHLDEFFDDTSHFVEPRNELQIFADGNPGYGTGVLELCLCV